MYASDLATALFLCLPLVLLVRELSTAESVRPLGLHKQHVPDYVLLHVKLMLHLLRSPVTNVVIRDPQNRVTSGLYMVVLFYILSLGSS